MFRKNLIPLLLDKAMSVNQIARLVGQPAADTKTDLEHFLKSLKHTGYEPVIFPAECRRCDFEFSSAKLSKPSKCPKCHGTWLTEPQISIRLRGKIATKTRKQDRQIQKDQDG